MTSQTVKTVWTHIVGTVQFSTWMSSFMNKMDCSGLCYNVTVLYMAVFLVLIQCFCVNSQQYEGDDCNLDGTPGSCMSIDNCPDVLRNISSKRPQTCGFTGTTPIICCPKVQKNETLKIDKEIKVGKKAKEKCIEYSSYVYEWILPDNETDPEKKVRVNNCGHIASALVIGHDVTSIREYPHMAILGMKGENETREWTCGGILISEQFVLTAAHCTKSRDYGKVRWARLGEHSLDMYKESETQDFGIDEIIIHPDFKPPSKYNDIALLKLDRRAILNKFVIPACLHTEFEVQQKTAVATGWGKVKFYDDETRLDLAKVVLEIFTQKECNATYRSLRHLSLGVTENMICAGHRTLSRGTCQGDSGGPLQIYLKTPYCMYDIIGVLSFGKLCGLPGIPDVFTRVSPYVGWIESVVWPE